jgi:hypothetical protein
MFSKKVPILLAAAAACHGLRGQTAAAANTPPPTQDETIVLSPFEVTTEKDNGYATAETLAGTRIRTNLDDVASSISVVTKQFLQDTGATDSGTLLQYTTNAEVAGTRGTYAGLGNGTSVNETPLLLNPQQGNRIRGLAAADNTRDFFVTDIPWDSYNVDRIDIQRGPNAILFGLGSPGGIINASLHNAEFRTFASVQDRVGSYGSTRESLDANVDVLPDVFAVRVDGLIDDQKYEQKEAFQNDKRISAALRFDPQLFKDRSFHTSIKLKIESGNISSDRPRIITPNDSITAWFRPVDNTSLTGGLGKLSLNSAYGLSAQPQTVSPWLSAAANQQQPIWFEDGATGSTYQIYSGYINNGFIDSTGKFRGVGSSAVGQVYSDEFYTVNSLNQYALNAKLPNYQFGQYRQQSLTDPSVFDFYHNLIDGPTASQFEKWTAYNIDVQQTGWDDRVGVELSYDKQRYSRGGQSLFNNPTISIDMLEHFQDGSVNPNFGRPFISAGNGGSGSSYTSNREYVRASLFGELRASDFFKNDFLVKLLGRQRFNGVYSNEKYHTENVGWQEYANSLGWDAYWNGNAGNTSPINNRPPVAVVYLGPSIANQSTASGANIPGITAPIAIQGGGVYSFNSTWNAPTVSPAAPWTVPATLAGRYDTTATTQASNPANYIGWNSNFQDSIISDVNGDNPQLTSSAQKAYRVTDSYAGTWQGYLWNDAIVPTLGWRYDEVKTEDATALHVTNNRNELNLDPTVYKLPDEFPENQIFKNHSVSGGMVVHLNKLFGEKDHLPFNISVSYNKSSNFQVTDVRHDVLGNPLSNPDGDTREYGVTIATKDDRFSLKITHYKTTITNGSATLDTSNLIGTVVQGLKWRNIFLYQMSAYTWDTREQTDDTPGKRYFWTPAYINSAGRPVADATTVTAGPAGSTVETQAQADAHRDASINAWNAIQSTLDGEGFFKAWNFTPTTLSALTDRSTYAATLTLAGSPDGKPIPAAQYMPVTSTVASYAATAPSNLTVTSDSVSKGYEFEFTANPTKNWRITFNAAETTAIQANVGGAVLDSLVSYLNTQMAGVAGDMRQFNGQYVAGNEVRQNWANFYGQYVLLKLQQGSDSPELRKWRYNMITNYTFDHGWAKGFGVGGGYRWQDRVVIGYPVITGTGGTTTFDLTKPYYGPSEDGLDLWVSYERKLTKKINWSIQANIYNVGKSDGLVPISVEPDGHTWAAVRIAPTQEWQLTNTFSF